MHLEHLLRSSDLTAEDVRGLLQRASSFKERRDPTRFPDYGLALMFEKPSLRTRVSFEMAMVQLGGHSVYLSRTTWAWASGRAPRTWRGC